MLLIGGFQKSSLIDYPEKISAIVFTQGCNFRCPYCHNPELITEKREEERGKRKQILDFLKSRIGKLDGVVITGGEPTLHEDLPQFIKEIKNLGFAVKLDTNGTNPDMLKNLIYEKMIDYVAMDIKAPIDKYSEIVCNKVNTDDILKSIEILKTSYADFHSKLNFNQESRLGLPTQQQKADIALNESRRNFDYEFRTTVVKSQLSIDDFEKIGELIKGAPKYYLQRFLPTKTLNRFYINQTTYSDEEFIPIIENLKEYVNCVELR